MKAIHILFLLIVAFTIPARTLSQDTKDISIRITKINNNIVMLDCVDGFGGGNVTASIGEDGILIADAMYESMVPKIVSSLKTLSDKPIRMVLNSHFHRDHIQGNKALANSATIVGHENIFKRMAAQNDGKLYPHIAFTNELTIRFNGENIKLIHFANCHTDSDAIIYFEDSKVLHLGDLFFFEMFPAVYTEGGGNIRNLIKAVESILADFPAETKVIPGHGNLATMNELRDYLNMLKETVSIVEKAISEKKSATEVQSDPRIAKYAALGEGGAQTTEQYIAMLFKLLK